jgi:PadR family transcriptional regulator, regulatory protein PadR
MDSVDTQGLARTINELLVLTTLRDAPKHGYQIALDVETVSGGAFLLQHGTLYPILHRLEREGLIRGKWEDPAGERRRKRYALSAAGRRRLTESTGEVKTVFARLLALLGEDDGTLRSGFATS